MHPKTSPYAKTVDEDFVKVEVQFRELENAVHVLIKDVTSYLAALGVGLNF